MLSKSDIRRQIGEDAVRVDPGYFETACRAVQANLLAVRELMDATMVFCYVSVSGEIDTSGVLEWCRTRGIHVCVPAYDDAIEVYRPALLDTGGSMTPGRFGIPEPVMCEWVEPAEISVCVVPGVAFGRDCARLGRGGGYYDRLLADLVSGSCLLIGLALEFQILDTIPVEKHDILMDAVVTEKRVYRKLDGVSPGIHHEPDMVSCSGNQ